VLGQQLLSDFFSCLIQHADSKPSERKRRLKDDVEVKNSKKSDESPPVKKRKTTTDKQKAKAKSAEPAAAGEAAVPKKIKPANPLGSLIGRKRKERKSGGKKGGR
jgi:nucleolar protein 4